MGRAIDDVIEQFRRQLREERERQVAEMRKGIIAPLEEAVAALSLEIAQMRLRGSPKRRALRLRVPLGD